MQEQSNKKKNWRNPIIFSAPNLQTFLVLNTTTNHCVDYQVCMENQFFFFFKGRWGVVTVTM